MSRATLMPFTMARALDEPCEMMHTPLSPSNMAPPVLSGSNCEYKSKKAGMSASACSLYCGSPIAVNSALTTAFIAPSKLFSATLPVKPSVTTTSTSVVMMSRPSTLPMKLMPVCADNNS
ncbi:MAG: hypothetical protein ABR58_00460 [Acidimicrobium sp. BACL19 MAG-120924-bin39]|nr:MAG: hypothetical protein ABR58_00460 [Acidimicrobium sp. BACL19 MAG-120924-bin39]